jgi:hypothetical protein
VTRAWPNFKAEREHLFTIHKRVMLVASIVVLMTGCLVGFFAEKSHAVREIGRSISWPLQFVLRDYLKKQPQIHPDVLVIMFDDSTVEALKRPYLNFTEWASVFTFLASHNPSSIYVDKIFGVVDGDINEVQKSLPALRMLRTRVSAGVYTSSVKIPGRPSLDLNEAQFSARRYLSDSYSDVTNEAVQTMINRPQIKDITDRKVYGPTPELRSVFLSGHIDWPSAHEIFPLYRSGPRSLIPALALSGNINLKVESTSISAMGTPMPLTQDGSMLVNWIKPDELYSKSLTLLDVISKMNSGKKWAKIRENAHIVILPQAFTGSADFVSSPYGPALGGLVHASVLNSVLTKTMLMPKQNTLVYLILLVVLSVALQSLRGIASWFALFSLSVLIVFSGILQFVYQSQEIPWVLAGTLFLLSGVSILSVRSFGERRMTTLLLQLEKEYERLGKEEKRLSNEIAEAAKVAQSLIPDKAPEWPKYWVSEFHKSATDLSGDWYFFESSASGRFGHFVMCDISGHGVQAAIVVSCCKTILTSLRVEKSSIFESSYFGVEYASKLNAILFEHGQGRHSTTLLSLTFDFYEGKVYVVNCGHTFPIVSKFAEKQWGPLLAERIIDPLGFSESIQVHVTERHIEQGDALIVYSDGTLLNRHRRLLKRYFEELNSDIQISAKRLFDAAHKEQVRRGAINLLDDVSLVVFKRLQ